MLFTNITKTKPITMSDLLSTRNVIDEHNKKVRFLLDICDLCQISGKQYVKEICLLYIASYTNDLINFGNNVFYIKFSTTSYPNFDQYYQYYNNKNDSSCSVLSVYDRTDKYRQLLGNKKFYNIYENMEKHLLAEMINIENNISNRYCIIDHGMQYMSQKNHQLVITPDDLIFDEMISDIKYFLGSNMTIVAINKLYDSFEKYYKSNLSSFNTVHT